MKYLAFLASIVFFACFSCVHAESEPNQLSAAEKRAGWQLLFDGQSTDAWRNYKQDSVGEGWSVSDGLLTRVPDVRRAGDIITKETFEHFELSLEYRISKGGNSGLMFHVTEEGQQSYHTGPEVQIQDNVDGHDPQKSGWLYQLYKPVNPGWQYRYQQAMNRAAPETLDATRPAGEWNSLYLRVANQGEVIVNGAHYYNFQKGTDDWNERVAKSKFAKWELFGKATEGHICLQDHGNEVSFRNIKVRRISANGYSHDAIDGTLKLKSVPAFPNLSWQGWQSAEETGKYRATRPLNIVPAHDGTNRLFVAMQSGAIHTVVNDSSTTSSKLFLNLENKVMDWNNGFVENEEGLLGLALHPDYKTNGQLFVYYTPKDDPRRSVVSRFIVSKNDPDLGDADSEEILLETSQPFPNHNGGGLAFGPDGYLYIGMGDGGLRNDYLGLAQDLSSLHGSILRIDVNRQQAGKPYAIPADNPFIKIEGARPEIFAYGFRNIWGISFDRKNDQLWIADVGQDLFEEINIVKQGGNYGWSMREGTKPFGNRQVKMISPPIDPIWEYDHQLGKSITGGFVYRGTRLPELQGHYIYADFVTNRVWALKYDEAKEQVVSNMAISVPINALQVMAFAEDAQGELLYVIQSQTGQSIHRFESP